MDPPASRKIVCRVIWGTVGGIVSNHKVRVVFSTGSWPGLCPVSQAALTASLNQQLSNSCVYQNPLEGSLKSSLSGLSPEVVIQWVLGGADNLHF